MSKIHDENSRGTILKFSKIQDHLAGLCGEIRRETAERLSKELGLPGFELAYRNKGGCKVHPDFFTYDDEGLEKCSNEIYDKLKQAEKDQLEEFCAQYNLIPGQEVEHEAFVPVSKLFASSVDGFFNRFLYTQAGNVKYSMKVFVSTTLTHDALIGNDADSFPFSKEEIAGYSSNFEQRLDKIKQEIAEKYLPEYTTWLNKFIPVCVEYYDDMVKTHAKEVAYCEEQNALRRMRGLEEIREIARECGIALPGELAKTKEAI